MRGKPEVSKGVPVSSMKWLKASLLVQIILAAYFQVILWFPLGSWNDQPGKRLIALLSEGQALGVVGFALAMLLPVLLFSLAIWKRWVWLIWRSEEHTSELQS